MIKIRYLVGLAIVVAIILLLIFMTPEEREDKAAETLGQKLFAYGCAAVQYAKDNPRNFEPEDERLAFYGTSWLQPEYLPADFNFKVNGFTIKDVEPGKGPVKVVLNIREAGLGHYFLEVELIEFGEIYAGKNIDMQAALRATRYANNFRKQGEPSNIYYRLAIETVDGKEAKHIIGVDRNFPNTKVGIDAVVPSMTDTFKAPATTKPQGE